MLGGVITALYLFSIVLLIMMWEVDKMYAYKAIVSKVVDGDTLDVDIDLGFHLKTNQRIRLYGIDAFEMKGDERPLGEEAKEFLKVLLEGKEVYLETIGTDKYGRWLANVYINDGGKDINVSQLLIENGHAKPYIPLYPIKKAP